MSCGATSIPHFTRFFERCHPHSNRREIGNCKGFSNAQYEREVLVMLDLVTIPAPMPSCSKTRTRLTSRTSTFDSLEEEIRRIVDDLEEDKAMNKAPTPEKAKEIAEVRPFSSKRSRPSGDTCTRGLCSQPASIETDNTASDQAQLARDPARYPVVPPVFPRYRYAPKRRAVEKVHHGGRCPCGQSRRGSFVR